ncbi:DMT family transporter [Pelagibaculum spongiae]|uniref:EamA family transporter n=1 Tax=Pelagibaculum spongiae TaxID=2080658 RepID=A0A2V1H2W4_9GAMM|nr:DMT family transporter [Pelagibaculum spongiae]PVZ70349.1 EamA family transporter [Pelagibaculum spongiae]
MSLSSLFQLLGLSAIWGGSFLFMRMAVPALGPAVMIELRVLFAAIFLAIVALIIKKKLNLRQHWRTFLFLGLFNTGLPFLLIAYAAQTLSVSLLSIINAMAPVWGVVIGFLWKGSRLTVKTALGLLLGVVGVAVLVGFDASVGWSDSLAVMASLAAALCYGIASNFVQHNQAEGAKPIEPFANAHGSMWAASLWLLPFIPFAPANYMPSPTIALAVVALGVVCSGIAYLMYFKLIVDIGAPGALTVTFLVPFFGVLWGVLFLAEPLSWNIWVGAPVVVAGTMLVTGFSASALFKRKRSS